MTKIYRAVSIIATLAIVGAIVAQNRANSNTQTNGQNAKASASSSSSSNHSGDAFANGGGMVGPWRDPSKEVYIIRYTPGLTWKTGKTYFEQPLTAHSQYLVQLQKANILLLAGPFKDNSGEELIIQVNNEAEAMDVVEGDPGVIMKVLVPTLKPWHLSFENTGRTTYGNNGQNSRGNSGPTKTSNSRSGGG